MVRMVALDVADKMLESKVEELAPAFADWRKETVDIRTQNLKEDFVARTQQ